MTDDLTMKIEFNTEQLHQLLGKIERLEERIDDLESELEETKEDMRHHKRYD